MEKTISLTSEYLQFDRGGRFIAATYANRVVVIDTERPSEAELVLATRNTQAMATFDDHVWVASKTTVERYGFDGKLVGAPFEVALEIESWAVAPCGPAGVVSSTQPRYAVVDDFGELAVIELPEAELVIPFTARRVVTISGSRVRMPSGVTAELPRGARAAAGHVLADGKWLVLSLFREGRRELALVGLGSGQLVMHLAIAPGPTRLSLRRGLVVVQVEPDRMIAVDLRVGRESGAFEIEPGFDDFAIDPDGARVAVRRGARTEILDVAKLIREPRVRWAAAASDATASRELAMIEPPVLASGSQAAIAVAPLDEERSDEGDPAASLAPDQPLWSLAPRRGDPPVTRTRALECLEHERTLILARCRLGIALGWDTRRLGYANESSHPFELEVAALLGAGHGHAASLVDEGRRALAEADAARARERQTDFALTPLGGLAEEFGLTPLELDILMAVAAPTLWGETARLYAVLANDPGRGIVDEVLVEQLLASNIDRYDIAAALAPDGALRRHGLFGATSSNPRPFTHLAIAAPVAGRLRAETLAPPEAITIRTASRTLDELVVPRDAVAMLVKQLSARSAGARIVVRGRPGSGRRTLLAAICALANRALGVIDVSLPAAGELSATLRALLQSASLCGLVPCLVGAVRDSDLRVVVDAVASHPGPVVAAVGTDDPIALAGQLELTLPALTARQRLDHWRDVIARYALRVEEPEELSSRFRLAPGIVERAAVRVNEQERPRESDATRSLAAAIRSGRDERLQRLATRVTRLPRWSDIVLPPDVLDSLRELVGRVRHARRVFEDWGFDDVMTTGRGLTALFDGRPGTGKTMVAGVIARELGLDLYRVDVSRLVSKWIGETEKNLGEIFDAVDDGQAIILFDEADSLFGRRTEVKSSNDRYANLEVNYLLQRIDSFDGIAILTTNFGSAIDPAFRRRISFRLSFPFPDEEAREQLWRVHIPSRVPIEGELDLSAIARKFQLAGGYIRNACLRAAFLAAQEETSLAQRHLERAVQLEYQQVGKISTSGPVE